MKTQDIKNMAAAIQQVAENQKAAMQKKLAKSAAPSEKGKAAVTLPKAPWDKKNEAMDPVDHKELKGKHKDRKDKDIDNDGDVDKSDEYLHNRRKAVSKAMKKEGDEEVVMNPKKEKKSKDADMNAMESTDWPIYKKIMEKRDAHYKGAAPADPKDVGQSPGGKKMKADLEAGSKVDDTEEKGHEDARKAGVATKVAPARNGDNKKGDKTIINPPEDITKKGGMTA